MELEKTDKVFNFDYEKYGESIFGDTDTPRMSIIEYSEGGQVIFEDYSKLDEYIEKKFIPEKVKYEIDNNDNNYRSYSEYKGKTRLNDILSLNLCFLEMCHVIDYLKEKNIVVVGKLPNLNVRFDNYFGITSGRLGEHTSYIANFNIQNNYLKLSPEETMSKLIEYNDPKSPNYKSRLLKKEIIEGNLGIVCKTSSWILEKVFNNSSDININELESYGYEILIRCVDNYDPSKGINFQTYASHSIKQFIIGQILASNCNEYKRSSWGYNYSICKRKIEKMTGQRLEENYKLAYMINDLMDEKGYIGKTIKKEENLNRILLTIQLSLEEYTEENQIQSIENVEEEVEKLELEERIKEALDSLTNKQLQVIKYIYGFEDGRTYGLAETGKILGVTRECVRRTENISVKKLRHPSIRRKLKDFY